MAKRPTKNPASAIDTTVSRLSSFEQTKNRTAQPFGSDLVPISEDDTGDRFFVFSSSKGVRVELRYHGDTFWASQPQLAEMFGIDRTVVGRHIKKVFDEGELDESGNVHTVHLSPTKPTKLYSLNVMISVGYRVESRLGTMFRVWATEKLFQILSKGFYVDKEHLKEAGEADALDEFREIAREIRASIRNSYREVLRLCTLCADYDGSSVAAREFFMSMENKLLWAATAKTGPQLILERCSALLRDLGLSHYSGRRGPTQRDVVVANNYLADDEAKTKNRITEMWLTYVEEQLEQGRLPTMETVRSKLDGFIRFNQWPILSGRGRHSREDAQAHALRQLAIYRGEAQEREEITKN